MALLLLTESNAVPDTRFAPVLSRRCACRRCCCCSISIPDLRRHVDVGHARAEGAVKVDVVGDAGVVTGCERRPRADDQRLPLERGRAIIELDRRRRR